MSTLGVTPSSTPSSISRRRNGLQPACEPCRKSKIRCDYSTTTTSCSRCKKRQILPQCIVLDSPMTNNGKTTSTRFIAHKPRASRNKFPITPSPSIATPRVDIAPVISEERVPDSTGFFGSTSFHDTLRQAAHGLREMQGEFDDDPQSLPMKLDLAVKLLHRVPSQHLCEKTINHSKPNSGEGLFPKAVVREVNASFWATYGEELRRGELEAIGGEITRCTKVALKQFGTPQGWREQFCGPNTRWEVLGLLFSSFTFGIAASEENDLMFSDPSEPEWTRKKALNGMKACVEMCIELCGNSLNILTTILLYRNLLLETIIHGDASITVWRLHHDLVAMGTAQGLHCYQGTSEVTIHSELTKRLSSALFWGDKEIALFTGRPPALTRQYHTCPPPLDISDEALLAGGDVLQQEIDNLDENGWNREKKFHSATLIRKLVLVSFIQDEVMELFVANNPEQQFFKERVDALKRKTTEIYKQMPMKIDAKKEMLSASINDTEVWNLLFNRLDFLRVHLNLERLASERGHDSKEKLYQIARELVDLAVFFWVERDRSRDRDYDYDFVIMCYGMPSTGILCTALLKQTQYPSEVPESIKLPTSEVVQNLSLMVGFLEWIRPFAGSYKLCQRMAKVIRRVLDQVFEPTPEVPVSSQESQEEGGQGPWQLEDPWQVDLSSEWNWLNSIDWNRGVNGDLRM